MSKMRFPLMMFFCTFVGSLMYFLFSAVPMMLEFDLMVLLSLNFSCIMIIDKVSVSFSLLVMFISSCVFMFSCEYMKDDPFYWRFTWLLFLFVVSMNLLIFSGSLFLLLLGWDGLGISSFALIIYYSSNNSLFSGYHTLLINRIGDALLMCGSAVLAACGQYSILNVNFTWVLVFMFILVAMTKSAQYPFCSWLPAAMAAPTPVSALVHSSTLVTAGIFLLYRLSYGSEVVDLSMLLLIGSLTSFLAGAAAMLEFDIKKIIALSTLSQLGIMMFCLGMGQPTMALFHLYAHALFKAALFLVAGSVMLCAFGSQDIRFIGSMASTSILTMTVFNICSLSLAAAPFLSSFFTKHCIMEMMFLSNMNMVSVVLMFCASVLTVGYVGRMMRVMSWSTSESNNLFNINPSSFVKYPPLLLSMGAVFSGKMLSGFFVAEVLMLPKFYWNMLSVSVFLLGSVAIFVLSSWLSMFPVFFVSLLYMAPFYLGSTYVLSPFMKKMGHLINWLEPSTLFSKPSDFTSNSMLWPNITGSLLRVLTISLMCSLVMFWFV